MPINIQAMNISLPDVTDLYSLCFQNEMPPPAVIAATSQELGNELLKRSDPIPLGSRQTWMELQKSDPDCQAVFNMKSFEICGTKDSKRNPLKLVRTKDSKRNSSKLVQVNI